MGWYSVVKTIKGRQYLYRQRTYRFGGKVRTESQYVGAFGDGAAGAVVDITSLDEIAPQMVSIRDNTTTSLPHPSLEVTQAVHEWTGLSVPALAREERHARELMAERGIDIGELKPVRVAIGEAVGWRRENKGYEVFTPQHGHRIRFKREYRAVLGMRWLDALGEQDPEQYEKLRTLADEERNWLRTKIPVKQHWFTYLVSWWSGRDRWKEDVAEMAGEMIQRGSKATVDRYAKAADKAEREARREWCKFKQLRRPAARRRQYRKAQAAYQKSDRLSARHGIALWTRLYLYGERPHD